MASAFLNYRREDSSGYAGRLFDGLTARFGKDQIFRDIDRIEPGLDFTRVIDESLKKCVAVLVLIGPKWLELKNDAGEPRLHDEIDYVRFEIEQALARGVRVIPVLVPGVRTVPSEADLPDSIKALAKLHAFTLSEESWNAQVEKLADLLQRLGLKAAQQPVEPRYKKIARNTLMALGGMMLLGVIVGTVFDDALDDPLLVGVAPRSPAPGDVVVSPEPAPEPAIRPRPLNTAADIMALQRGLALLGYYSGSVDGVAGPRTATALQQYQADEGLTPDGQMTVALLDRLKQQTAGVDSSRFGRGGAGNITGTWYDNYQNRYEVRQQGNQISAQGYGPTGDYIGEFAGELNGRTLTYRYDMPLEGRGTGVGMLQPDDRHIVTQSRDNAGGSPETNQLHRGHLPSSGY